jgi:probable phosphoglycerate mutase
MKRLILVRHGESEWNAGRRLQGQADIALSRRGEEQARALQPLVAGLRPARVVASSLKRARDTAALLGFPDAAQEDGLREIDVGEWTGAAISDLVARGDGAYRMWRAGLHTPQGGEAWKSFKARTAGAIRAILDSAEGDVLVVSHGGVVRALLESLLGLSPERIVPVAPGSLTVLQCHSPEWRLEIFNYSPGGPALDAPD